MSWLDWLISPLSYPFMQRALLAALATGTVCAVLSCFLVLKGWSPMGDAISHAVLPGIVLAFAAGLPLAVGAFVAGVGRALGTGYIRDRCRLKEDTVMGILYTGMFGFGLVLFTRIDTDQHLNHILFGNVLGISPRELLHTLLIAGVVTLVVLLKRRDLALFCFDVGQAAVLGLRIPLLHYGLLCLLGLTVVASLQAVGVILVIAMLITPGITALTLCSRFDAMLALALLTAAVASLSGTLLSFHFDAATGACIVLVQSLLFVLAVAYRHITGRCRASLLP